MIIKINQKKEKSVEKKEKFWSNYLKFPKRPSFYCMGFRSLGARAQGQVDKIER